MNDPEPWHRLISRRKEARFSQLSLAKALDISSTAVWNWEWGYTKPRPAILGRLAKLLDTTEEWLTSEDPVLETPSAPESLADVIARAKAQIADAAGLGVDQVKITLEA